MNNNYMEGEDNKNADDENELDKYVREHQEDLEKTNESEKEP